MAKPSVKSAKVDNASNVVFEFTDGHTLRFVYNNGGFRAGDSTAVEAIELSRNKKLLITYNSPYQHPVNRRSFGIQGMPRGYSVKRFTEYVTAAHDHSAKLAKDLVSHETWSELYKAEKDLRDLKAGKVKVVEPKSK